MKGTVISSMELGLKSAAQEESVEDFEQEIEVITFTVEIASPAHS